MSSQVVSPTELEKHSLEAHTELCAQRYKYLEDKLEAMDEELEELKALVREIHAAVHTMDKRRNDQVIRWGVGIISSMGAVIAYLAITLLNI